MKAKRFRLQYKFWLDMNKLDEQELAEKIEQLKARRKFSQVVRDGIRLVSDLLEGSVGVLLELFPDVEGYFYARFREQEPPVDTTLLHYMERLEALLLSQGTQLPQMGGGALKAMAVPQFATPIFDDEDEEITLEVKRDASSNAVQNFLSSVSNLAH